MKFQLTRPTWDYNELMEKYGDILKDFGFEVKRITDFASEMEIKLSAVIDWMTFHDDDCDNIYCFINIDSLDELMDLRRRLTCNVIIGSDDGVDFLEIYDGYRE